MEHHPGRSAATAADNLPIVLRDRATPNRAETELNPELLLASRPESPWKSTRFLARERRRYAEGAVG